MDWMKPRERSMARQMVSQSRKELPKDDLTGWMTSKVHPKGARMDAKTEKASLMGSQMVF